MQIDPFLLDKFRRNNLETEIRWHSLPFDLNGFRLSLKFSSTGDFSLFGK